MNCLFLDFPRASVRCQWRTFNLAKVIESSKAFTWTTGSKMSTRIDHKPTVPRCEKNTPFRDAKVGCLVPWVSVSEKKTKKGICLVLCAGEGYFLYLPRTCVNLLGDCKPESTRFWALCHLCHWRNKYEKRLNVTQLMGCSSNVEYASHVKRGRSSMCTGRPETEYWPGMAESRNPRSPKKKVAESRNQPGKETG